MDGKSQTSNQVVDENDEFSLSRFWNSGGEVGCHPNEWGMTPDVVGRWKIPERLELDDVPGGHNRREPHPLLLVAFSSIATIMVCFPFMAIDGDWNGGERGIGRLC